MSFFSDHPNQTMPWPQVKPRFVQIDDIFQQIYRRYIFAFSTIVRHEVSVSLFSRSWRLFQIIQLFTEDQRAQYRLKLRTGRYLRQRVSYFERSINQNWLGDYLSLVREDSDSNDHLCVWFQPEKNPQVKEYKKSIDELREKDQFKRVFFSIIATKVRRIARLSFWTNRCSWTVEWKWMNVPSSWPSNVFTNWTRRKISKREKQVFLCPRWLASVWHRARNSWSSSTRLTITTSSSTSKRNMIESASS